MLKTVEALRILNIKSETPHKDLVVKQFRKLRRRYPHNEFPQRHKQIVEAYNYLTDSKQMWGEYIQSHTIDLSWLLDYLECEEKSISSLSSPWKFKQDLYRQLLLSDLEREEECSCPHCQEEKVGFQPECDLPDFDDDMIKKIFHDPDGNGANMKDILKRMRKFMGK